LLLRSSRNADSQPHEGWCEFGNLFLHERNFNLLTNKVQVVCEFQQDKVKITADISYYDIFSDEQTGQDTSTSSQVESNCKEANKNPNSRFCT